MMKWLQLKNDVRCIEIINAINGYYARVIPVLDADRIVHNIVCVCVWVCCLVYDTVRVIYVYISIDFEMDAH